MNDVVRLAKKAKLPTYMWDTTDGLAALARFMDLARDAVLEEAAIAWMYKTVIHCGQGQFYDSDWKVSLHKPPDSAVCVTPLYKSIPRDDLIQAAQAMADAVGAHDNGARLLSRDDGRCRQAAIRLSIGGLRLTKSARQVSKGGRGARSDAGCSVT